MRISILIGLIVTFFFYRDLLLGKKNNLYKKRDIVFHICKKDPFKRKTILENGYHFYISYKESTINTCYFNFTPKLKEERDYLQLSFNGLILEYVYIFSHYGIDLLMKSKGPNYINLRQKLINLEKSTKIFYSFGRKIDFFRGKKTFKNIHIESFCIKSPLDSKENEINFSLILDNAPINYGLIIILNTFLMKVFLFPIIYKQYELNLIMNIILTEFSNTLKDILEIYREICISPMSGVISSFLQLINFYSLLIFFTNLTPKHVSLVFFVYISSNISSPIFMFSLYYIMANIFFLFLIKYFIFWDLKNINKKNLKYGKKI